MTALFVDLGVHHNPGAISDRIAFGFTLPGAVLADRAHEAHCRVANRGFANELADLHSGQVAQSRRT